MKLMRMIILKFLKKKNKSYINKISEYQYYNIDKSTTFPLIDDNKNRNVQLVKDIENSLSSFIEEPPKKKNNRKNIQSEIST